VGRVSGVKVASGFGAAGLVLAVLGLDALCTRGWALFCLFGLICAGASWEAAKIIRARHHLPNPLIPTASLAFFMLSAPLFTPSLFLSAFPWLQTALLGAVFLWALSNKDSNDAAGLAFTFLLPPYIGGGLAFLCLLNRTTTSYAAIWPALVIFVVKANDILGYLLGVSLGRRRLHPISPAKTVEGSLFGLGGGVGVAFLTKALFGVPMQPFLLVLFALACGALGQLGDLSESLLKRYAGVKDSANLMPGSGGMLDFCDCFLLASPAAFAILYKVPHA